MVEAATAEGLLYDPRLLNLYPDPSGPQHDETRRLPFSLSRKIDREVIFTALHGSVRERYLYGPVLQYDLYADYRPVSLKGHFDLPPPPAGA